MPTDGARTAMGRRREGMPRRLAPIRRFACGACLSCLFYFATFSLIMMFPLIHTHSGRNCPYGCPMQSWHPFHSPQNTSPTSVGANSAALLRHRLLCLLQRLQAICSGLDDAACTLTACCGQMKRIRDAYPSRILICLEYSYRLSLYYQRPV